MIDRSIEKKKPLVLCVVQFEKAFDIVGHEELIKNKLMDRAVVMLLLQFNYIGHRELR